MNHRTIFRHSFTDKLDFSECIDLPTPTVMFMFRSIIGGTKIAQHTTDHSGWVMVKPLVLLKIESQLFLSSQDRDQTGFWDWYGSAPMTKSLRFLAQWVKFCEFCFAITKRISHSNAKRVTNFAFWKDRKYWIYEKFPWE